MMKSALMLTVALMFAGCGGGGGAGTVSGGGGTPPPVVDNTVPVAAAAPTTLGLANAGPFSGTFVKTVMLANDYSQALRNDITSGIAVGTFSGACDQGGTLTTTLSADRLTLTEDFSGCRSENGSLSVTIDGRLITEYTSAPGDAAFVATMTFDGLRVSDQSGVSELAKGQFEFNAGVRQGLDSTDVMILDMSIDSSLEGTLRLSNLTLNVNNSIDFLNSIVGLSGVSGSLSQSTVGEIDASFDTGLGVVTLTGTGSGVARIEILGGRTYTTFHQDADAVASAYNRLSHDETRDLLFFDDTVAYTPLRRTTTISDLRNLLVIDADLVPFNLRDNFSDWDGDLMTIELVVTDVTAQPHNGPTVVWNLDDAGSEYELTEVAESVFEFSSVLDEEVVTYSFAATATDATGQSGNETLEFSIDVYRDFDRDGDPDRFDNDDDGDGVTDTVDQFPLNAAEWIDTDLDGTGDNGDIDDDNDTALDVDDFYPLDARCSLELDGDGSDCWFSVLPNYVDAFIDINGVVYLSSWETFWLGRYTVRRFDTTTGHFLDSFDIDPAAFGLDLDTANFYLRYVASHHSLYVTYVDGLVTKIDLAQLAAGETLFHTLGPSSTSIAPALDFSPYVLVFEQGLLRARTDYSYDSIGSQIDRVDTVGSNSTPQISLPESSAICKTGFTLSRVDGTFFEFANPGGYDCEVFGEPVASPDGQSFLTFEGNIIDASLNVLKVMPFSTSGGAAWRWRWTVDGIYHATGTGFALHNTDGILLATQEPPVEIEPSWDWRILEADGMVAILYRYSSGIRILAFGPP